MEDLDFEPMKVRIAENESVFRSANERIELEAEANGYRGEKVPFLCECPDMSCTDVVLLTLEDYENIRTGPTNFFVVPGHQTVAVRAGVAIVIEDRDDACISERVGIAGAIAASHHGEDLSPDGIGSFGVCGPGRQHPDGPLSGSRLHFRS